LTHSLAEHLRFSLKQQNLVHELSEELRALEHYLCVQKVRFEEKLDYVFEIAPQAAETRVPAALIQPLLENALKFGQLTSPDGLRVRIAARVEAAGRLIVEVENSGSWVEPDPSASPSTGIPNLRRRLDLIYGEAAHLSLERNETGVVARTFIPMEIPR
jgi:LytS/YehU family sensor histidine kinase